MAKHPHTSQAMRKRKQQQSQKQDAKFLQQESKLSPQNQAVLQEVRQSLSR